MGALLQIMDASRSQSDFSAPTAARPPVEMTDTVAGELSLTCSTWYIIMPSCSKCD